MKSHFDSWSSAIASSASGGSIIGRLSHQEKSGLRKLITRSRPRLYMVDLRGRKISWTFPVAATVRDRHRGLRAAMNHKDVMLTKFWRPLPAPTTMANASSTSVSHEPFG